MIHNEKLTPITRDIYYDLNHSLTYVRELISTEKKRDGCLRLTKALTKVY